jgi:hypothetical protein
MSSTDFTYLSQRWEQPRNVKQAQFPHKPGSKLPNGAILLDETVIREYTYRRDSIVLCITNTIHRPFYSWHRIVTTDSPTATGAFQIVDTCAWGEQYANIEEAVDKFNERVCQKLQLLEGYTES